jgi:hypothetical protein
VNAGGMAVKLGEEPALASGWPVALGAALAALARSLVFEGEGECGQLLANVVGTAARANVSGDRLGLGQGGGKLSRGVTFAVQGLPAHAGNTRGATLGQARADEAQELGEASSGVGHATRDHDPHARTRSGRLGRGVVRGLVALRG